jgi:hypothetical protein
MSYTEEYGKPLCEGGLNTVDKGLNETLDGLSNIYRTRLNSTRVPENVASPTKT